MTGRARIGKKRKLAEIAGKVGATDAHAVRAHHGFVGTRIHGIGQIDDIDLLRGGKFNRVGHDRSKLVSAKT